MKYNLKGHIILSEHKLTGGHTTGYITNLDDEILYIENTGKEYTIKDVVSKIESMQEKKFASEDFKSICIEYYKNIRISMRNVILEDIIKKDIEVSNFS